MFQRELRTLAYVPRWAIIRTLRQQSVAEHSFYVALYADKIASMINWSGDRVDLFRVALLHDLDEVLTGDISQPGKQWIRSVMNSEQKMNLDAIMLKQTARRIPEYEGIITNAITDGNIEYNELNAIIKVADILEACLYLADEKFSGNGNVANVLRYLIDQLHRSIMGLPATVKELDKVLSAVNAAISRAELTPDMLVTIEDIQ